MSLYSGVTLLIEKLVMAQASFTGCLYMPVGVPSPGRWANWPMNNPERVKEESMGIAAYKFTNLKLDLAVQLFSKQAFLAIRLKTPSHLFSGELQAHARPHHRFQSVCRNVQSGNEIVGL